MCEIIRVGGGTPFCCNQEMEQLTEQTQDKGLEKHVPVVEKANRGLKVTVGSKKHPMTPDHHIEWIQIITDEFRCRQYLEPSAKPEAFFVTDVSPEKVTAREFCNLHDLWSQN